MINRKPQDKMAVSSRNIIASAISVNELNMPNNNFQTGGKGKVQKQTTEGTNLHKEIQTPGK